MNRFISLVALAIFSSLLLAHADVAPEKRKEIEKLLRVTGVERLTGQMVAQMVSTWKAQMPQVPEVFWEKFQQKVDTHDLIEKIIPVYDKYYSLEDLKAINAFYESPAGKKLISTLPQAMQEAMKIGQEWGEKIGKEAAEEAEQELKKQSGTKS